MRGTQRGGAQSHMAPLFGQPERGTATFRCIRLIRAASEPARDFYIRKWALRELRE